MVFSILDYDVEIEVSMFFFNNNKYLESQECMINTRCKSTAIQKFISYGQMALNSLSTYCLRMLSKIVVYSSSSPKIITRFNKYCFNTTLSILSRIIPSVKLPESHLQIVSGVISPRLVFSKWISRLVYMPYECDLYVLRWNRSLSIYIEFRYYLRSRHISILIYEVDR